MFKVIDFCCNQKPTYDLLLVINCHLSSNSHCFRDIASRTRSKTTLPQFQPQSMGLPSNFVIKLGRQRVKAKALGYILVKLNDPSFSHFVTIHQCHGRQTDNILWEQRNVAIALRRSAKNGPEFYWHTQCYEILEKRSGCTDIEIIMSKLLLYNACPILFWGHNSAHLSVNACFLTKWSLNCTVLQLNWLSLSKTKL